MTNFQIGQKVKRLTSGGMVHGVVSKTRTDAFYVDTYDANTKPWSGWWLFGGTSWLPCDDSIIATSNGNMATAWGAVCKLCNSKNEYAAPNQSDGTYVCYECR